MKKELFRLELFVRDLKKSVNFYENILGLKLAARSETAARFDLEEGSLMLSDQSILSEDHYFGSEQLKHRKGVGVELVIMVSDIEERYERVLTKQYFIYEKLKKQPWGMTDFRLLDPDGYYIRVTSTQTI